MDILGIGVPEFTFIILIAIIILGPKDMVSAGKTLGRMMRKIILSPEWSAMRKTGDELTRLPNRLMREAMLEDLQKELEDPLKAAEFSNRTIATPNANRNSAVQAPEKPQSSPDVTE